MPVVSSGRKSTSALSSVVLPACGASELSITPRRRSTTAHSVAISRASIAGVPISSTALIGVGGSQ